MSHSTQNAKVFYRFRLANAVVCAMMAFTALYFLVEANKTLGRGNSAGIVNVVFMVPFLLAALRFPLNGIVVTPNEVKIRNITKTHVVRWGEIDRFELGRYKLWPQIGVAVLRDGRRIPMTGVQAVRYDWSPATRHAKRTIVALTRRLAESRGEATPVTSAESYPSARSGGGDDGE